MDTVTYNFAIEVGQMESSAELYEVKFTSLSKMILSTAVERVKLVPSWAGITGEDVHINVQRWWCLMVDTRDMVA